MWTLLLPIKDTLGEINMNSNAPNYIHLNYANPNLSNVVYLAPQIGNINNWFHSEWNYSRSYDYPSGNHMKTRPIMRCHHFRAYSLLSDIFGQAFPPRGLKYPLIGYWIHYRNDTLFLATVDTFGCEDSLLQIPPMLFLCSPSVESIPQTIHKMRLRATLPAPILSQAGEIKIPEPESDRDTYCTVRDFLVPGWS